MVIRCLAGFLLMMALGGAAGGAAAQDRAGEFDYYVLALSWSPSWCAVEGDDRSAAQCQRGELTDFTVHGLWPQYESGWPQDCASRAQDPSRRDSDAMEDLMGSGGLAWYQWKKHGRCSGLSGRGYYAAIRDAWEAVTIPEVFVDLDREIRLPPSVIEEAFLEANPGMSPDGVTVDCSGDQLQEVRICLTRELELRDCSWDIRRDCPLPMIDMEAVR